MDNAPATYRTESPEEGSHRGRRAAVTGLLLLCVLSATGLLYMAYASYKTMQRAERAVLHGRAAEIAASLSASARLTNAFNDPERLKLLVEAAASETVSLVIVNFDGDVLAAAPAPAKHLPRPESILPNIRLKGELHRLRETNGKRYLEYWRPMAGGRRRGGPGRWRANQRRAGRGLTNDGRPFPRMGGPRGPGGRPRVKLLRVTVDASLAASLTEPAYTTLIMASTVAGLFLLLGFFLHRLERRTAIAERELQGKEVLASLGEMAAVLAHEIRTPLGSIKGNAQLLEEKDADNPCSQAIVRETTRLERLVNGMLDYARPTPPQRTYVDPNQTMARALEMVAPIALKHEVNLLTEAADDGTLLNADADQLLQILVNLLQNAVEAAKENDAGLVTIRVRADNNEITFSVLDNGPGFSVEEEKQLFRPFFSKRKGGTGLGLAVAKRLVERHQGQLRLKNRDEGGAEASAVFPLRG
jgi:signal transduction histidine kinase